MKKIGLEVKIGIEIEFVVVKKGTLEPYDNSTYYSLHSLAEYADDIESLIDELNDNGIELDQFHKEGAKGQFEACLKYGPVMQLIDNYYIAKEIIACFFKKRGYIASFLPKVMKDCGNGAHVHISIWRDGKNMIGDPKGRYGLS